MNNAYVQAPEDMIPNLVGAFYSGQKRRWAMLPTTGILRYWPARQAHNHLQNPCRAPVTQEPKHTRAKSSHRNATE